MKLATLIAALVLGTSSIAAAKPAMPPVVVRDHRAIALPIPAPRPTWIHFGTATAYKQVLSPNFRHPVDRLLLQANGWVYLEKVRIVFGNGQQQIETYNRWVGAAYGGLAIDLAGQNRTIKSIVVVTRPVRGSGSLMVFGRNDLSSTKPMPALPAGFTRLGRLADGAQTLEVSKNLSELAIATNGSAHIGVVTLHFATGAKHQMTLDRDLTASAPLSIALPRYRSQLVSITVHSTATRGSELALFGR